MNITKILIGASIVGVAAYLIYKPKTKASFVRPERWVVGAYQNGQTYIYPEGNYAGGYWVRGSVNVPSGTMFTPVN